MKQLAFDLGKAKYRYCHGGELRKKRAGRGLRQLSTKDPLHLVFKARRSRLRLGYRAPRPFQLVSDIIQGYARMFFVKIERCSIQNDHIHLLIRTTKRSQYQHFFRVVAGQIAQRFEREGLLAVVTDTPKASLWDQRPFTRIVRGYKPYLTVIEYIELNEQEARGNIPYRASRLRGLSMKEWELLWK